MIHTPLCPNNCEVDHHDIVNTLQALAPRFSSVKATIFSPLRATRGNNKEDFKKQVHMLLASGWQKDDDVPEPSDNLKLPLLLLSSMFGKFEAIEWLINEEHFDVSLRSSWTNETALHLVCRHLYVALSPSGSRLENMTITEKVANFEKVTSLLIEKDVSLFWAKDGLNKETPFHILARHLVNASLDDADAAQETEDLCLSYYSKSFDALLKLLQAEESARLSKRDFINILCAKNGDGDTVMHILAKDLRRGFQFLKYLVKSILCSTSYLRIKNTNGVTVMDIVTECNPHHLKDLQTESESEQAEEGKQPVFHGPKSPALEKTTLNLLRFIETEASSAVALCGEPGSVDSRKDVKCAIHTKGFPGLCSPNCSNVMSAVSSLLGTHTPFCPTGCDLQHHLLTNAVFNNSVLFRSYSEESIPITFKLCIQACLSEGWQRDMDVPDPLESLQYPLLHLIFMSGNKVAAKKVVEEMGFNLNICSSQSKESPLHVAARLFPSTYSDRKTNGISKVVKFKCLVEFVACKEKRVLFKTDCNDETVLHVFAHCITKISSSVDKSQSLYAKKTLMSQRECYIKAIKYFIEKLAELAKNKDVCRCLISRTILRKNKTHKTFLNVLQSDSEKTVVNDISVFTKGRLPYCFDKEGIELATMQCNESCICEVSGDLETNNRRSGIQATPCEAVKLVQEPVSSSVSPPLTMDTAAVEGPESRGGASDLMANQPRLAHVMHTCSSLSRPQAQVRSIQLQEQVLPAFSQSAYLQSDQHLPVIFIKQEPLEVQHETTCTFARRHSYPQNSVMIQASDGSTSANATPEQCVALDMVARKRSSTEDKMMSPSTATREIQTKVTMLQQQQWKVASEVLQTPQDMHEVLRQEKRREKDSTVPVPISRERLTILPLDDLTDTNYKIDCWHTSLCHSGCTIKHHPLVLTLCATTNRLNCKGFRLLEMTKVNFLKCLKAHLDQGWKKDQEVPDNAEFLRYPVVYLACIFFKYMSLELLTLHGFDPNIKLKGTNDYPMHVFLRHLYDQGSKLFKSFPFSGYRQFTKMFGLVSNGMHICEFLSLQGGNGDTLLHVGAKLLVKKLETETAVETPDSTQGCVSNGNSEQPSQTPAVCKLRDITEKYRNWANFYGHCMNILLDELYNGCLKDHVLDSSQAEPVLNARNHAGETFLDILCEEHHVSSDCITAVLSKFPLAALIESVKLAIPRSCWSNCIPGKGDNAMKKGSLVTGEANLTPLSLESSLPHVDRHTTPVSTLTADDPSDIISPATPSQAGVAGTDSLLDSVLTPVITTPGHMSLKPNTKRKIIEALKEDYTERLDLAITRCSEVEADIRKKKEITCKLTEELEKKDEEMKKLEREVQQLKKDIWLENQALKTLQNSCEQFKKEEIELKKSLAVLEEADPEPPSKRSKTQVADVDDSRL